MITAIILHGMPSATEYYNLKGLSPSNSHWLPWLQNKLLQNDILTQTPEMPKPFSPHYEQWRKTISQFDINEHTILVGHSCGAGFFLKYLSESGKSFKHLFLIAPWVDPDHTLNNNFFENTFSGILPENKITIFVSSDDDKEILKSVELIKEKYKGSNCVTFTNKGHFCFEDLKTTEFPELLENILSL